MGFDADLYSLMTDRIVAYDSQPTRDQHGVETWTGNASTFMARVVTASDRIRRLDGHVTEIRTIAWVAPTTSEFSTGTSIQLPDGSRPPVEAVESFTDEDGFHHVKLHFGYSRTR